MIELSAVEPIVAQYLKYGWKLRRILLTKEGAGIDTSAFPDVSINKSDIDAAWFSRSNKQGETWELRRLIGPPFALVRVVPTNTAESELQEILQTTEIEMLETPVKSTNEIRIEK